MIGGQVMDDGEAKPLRILYVGGWMRSGTTLLGEMLGACHGVVALGELSGLWRAADRDHSCSCGTLVTRCSVWGPALEEVEMRHGVGRSEYSHFAVQVQKILRTRSALSLSRLDPGSPGRWPPQVRRYVEVMDTLLRSVARSTGTDTFVDSSKLPPGFLTLRLLPRTRVDVVHIVRDPRAVAASERRTRSRVGAELETLPPGRTLTQSVVYWSAFNLAVRAFAASADSYRRVDYEALTTRVEPELSRLAADLDLNREPGAVLGQGHLAVGNPTRLGGPDRQVTTDTSWERDLTRRERLLVTVASAPARVALRASGQ